MASKPGITFHGLNEFKQELQVLNAGLLSEAEGILLMAAFDAASRILAAYPHGTGALRAGVLVVPSRGTVLMGGTLVNRAPHAHLYEKGTNVRENKHGDNRGRMTPRPTFWPIADDARGQAFADITRLLYQHRATRVTSDA